MPDDDPEQLADEFEREADQLERLSDEVKDHVQAARADWERKRQDDAVPGAAPREQDESSADADESDSDEEPPPESGRAG